MTALAARNAWRMTKSVRSVCSSATARKSIAFSLARIRKDIRLLSSTATLGMAGLHCVHIQIVHKTTTKINHQSCLVQVEPEALGLPAGHCQNGFECGARGLLEERNHALRLAAFISSFHAARPGRFALTGAGGLRAWRGNRRRRRKGDGEQ